MADVDIDALIERHLKHAMPYDPVKAHEYYERTKELKGRRNASDLKSQSKKESWGYVQDEVQGRQKAEREQIQKTRQETVARLQELMKTRAKELSEQLANIFALVGWDTLTQKDKISKGIEDNMALVRMDAEAQQEKIQKDVADKLAALPGIPKGLSKAVTAKLVLKRREDIARIRGEGQKSLNDLSDVMNARMEKVQTDGQRDPTNLSNNMNARKINYKAQSDAHKEQLVSDVKGKIEAARKKYETGMAGLKAKYEAELDSSFEAIKATPNKKPR